MASIDGFLVLWSLGGWYQSIQRWYSNKIMYYMQTEIMWLICWSDEIKWTYWPDCKTVWLHVGHNTDQEKWDLSILCRFSSMLVNDSKVFHIIPLICPVATLQYFSIINAVSPQQGCLFSPRMNVMTLLEHNTAAHKAVETADSRCLVVDQLMIWMPRHYNVSCMQRPTNQRHVGHACYANNCSNRNCPHSGLLWRRHSAVFSMFSWRLC